MFGNTWLKSIQILHKLAFREQKGKILTFLGETFVERYKFVKKNIFHSLKGLEKD